MAFADRQGCLGLIPFLLKKLGNTSGGCIHKTYYKLLTINILDGVPC